MEEDFNALWARFCAGETSARERLLAMHYDEFRRVARRVLSRDGEKLQIQPTDLAHEAAIRLLRIERLNVRDRAHFMALACRIMRQVLMDEIRRFRASKRQAPTINTQWLDPSSPKAPPALDLEAFDEALDRLGAIDATKAQIVEQRFYAGLTIEEIAEISGVSESTVKRQWRGARAWLLSQLSDESEGVDS